MEHQQATLVLYIHGQGYFCRRLPVDPRVAQLAWRLTKQDKVTVYDCHVDAAGPHCDCYSGLKLDGTGKPCKHIRALMDVHLL